MKKQWLSYLWMFLLQASCCLGQEGIAADAIVGTKLPPAFDIGVRHGTAHGPVRLADFAGKLLILDFWYTGCPACISGFPKLERLQDEFGDAIQVLLVNPLEDSGQIKERMASGYNRSNGLDAVYERNKLPVVLASDSLKALLSVRGFPSHAWIDAGGKIVLFGSALNTHAKKIRQFLQGKRIEYVHTAFTGTPYDFSEALLLRPADDSATAASAIRPFDSRYGCSESLREDIVEGASGAVRNTYLNTDILGLFHVALGESMGSAGWDDLVYSPVSPNRYAWHLAYVALDVADSNRYSRQYLPDSLWTDEHFSVSGHCYEQIAPHGVTDSARRSWMFEDLSRYCSSSLGVAIALDSVEIQCLVIRGTGKIAASPDHTEPYLNRTGDTLAVATHSNRSLKEAMASSLWRLFSVNPSQERLPVFFVGNTAHGHPLSLPAWNATSTLADFKDYIQQNGLEMVVTERRLPVLTIRETE